jgi:hypothetical protein
MLMDEITIPEMPPLIIPPGYEPRARRWRATWTRGYSSAALERAGAMVPIEERGEGASPEDAIDALLRPLCVRGLMEPGDELVVQVLEMGDDDVPDFWRVRIELDADGVWSWSVLEEGL